MTRACCVPLFLIALMSAGCNNAPDVAEEPGVLRIPKNIPAAPEGKVAAAGDRCYLFVPAEWKIEPYKFDESRLHEEDEFRLLDTYWVEGNDMDSFRTSKVDSTGAILHIDLCPAVQETFEQQAAELVEGWKQMQHTTVGHVENSPIALTDGTPAHLLVLEGRTEDGKGNRMMEAEGGHYLIVDLWTSVDPATSWWVRGTAWSDADHEIVHHDSELGKSLIESVKSLVIVSDAAELSAAPR